MREDLSHGYQRAYFSFTKLTQNLKSLFLDVIITESILCINIIYQIYHFPAEDPRLQAKRRWGMNAGLPQVN